MPIYEHKDGERRLVLDDSPEGRRLAASDEWTLADAAAVDAGPAPADEVEVELEVDE